MNKLFTQAGREREDLLGQLLEREEKIAHMEIRAPGPPNK